VSGRIEDLLAELIAKTRAAHPHRPALIGVGGAQGSGKTTICKRFAAEHTRVAHFSLDDIYLTRAERVTLAGLVNPLLLTRGPPGTHDLDLAQRTIESLAKTGATRLPRFDKARDDRAPENDWPLFEGPAEAILTDGWCMGAQTPPPAPPMNALERDPAGAAWIAAVEARLARDYQPFFARFDAIIYLAAPSWEIVRTWRGEQEEKLLGRAMTDTEARALDRFVQHYERITRAMLAGHSSAQWLVRLDEARNVIGIEQAN
jgi:D-glycerate 3-kinase